jgi:hypothetical protein
MYFFPLAGEPPAFTPEPTALLWLVSRVPTWEATTVEAVLDFERSEAGGLEACPHEKKGQKD